MIDTSDTKFDIVVDVGRPDIINEVTRQFWTDAHTFIKESEIPIKVNGVFYFIENVLAEFAEPNGGYMGGGFKYCFWFANEQDKKVFVDKMNDLDFHYFKMRRL